MTGCLSIRHALLKSVSLPEGENQADRNVTAPQEMAEHAQRAAKPPFPAQEKSKIRHVFSRAQPRISRFFKAVGLKSGLLVR